MGTVDGGASWQPIPALNKTSLPGGLGAVVLEQQQGNEFGSSSMSLHNLGSVSVAHAPSSGPHTTFTSPDYVQVVADTSSSKPPFVAIIKNDKPITFKGLPAPGATCGTGKKEFGCPFRTSGRGYVRTSDVRTSHPPLPTCG